MDNKTAFKRMVEGTGVRLEQHGGLLYVYLDTPEAVKLAQKLLPETQRGVDPEGREVWVFCMPPKGCAA